jgi:hypothetical protein
VVSGTYHLCYLVRDLDFDMASPEHLRVAYANVDESMAEKEILRLEKGLQEML